MVTNTLAYHDAELITAAKSFIVPASGHVLVKGLVALNECRFNSYLGHISVTNWSFTLAETKTIAFAS
jgi:hypothetical protein